MIKAVIFDMDGTLIDSEPIHDIIRTNTLLSLGFADGNSQKYKDMAVGVDMSVFWNKIFKENNLPYDNKEYALKHFIGLENYIRENDIKINAGAYELMEYLKSQAIDMSIASASVKVFVDFIVKFKGFDKYVKYWTNGECVNRAKPAPDIYLLTLEKLGLRPEECIAIEDTGVGVQSAVSAGIKCVGFKDANVVSEQDLTKCSLIVSDLKDVIPFLQKLNAQKN